MTNTKLGIALTVAACLFAWGGYYLGAHSTPLDTPQSTKAKPLYWVAPMDPEYRRDGPGQSPMGMALRPVYADTKTMDDKTKGVVTISSAVENNLGIKTYAVQRQNLDLSIHTTGIIQFDENNISHFHSRVEGWVEDLAVNSVGDAVKKGSRIFSLYSPELIYAQEEYLLALKSEAAGQNSMSASGARKLRSLGIAEKDISRIKKTGEIQERLPFHAGQDGYISELNIRNGMFISPNTMALSIGGLDQVWLIANIFTRQASWVKEGQAITMTNQSYPNKVWHGTIDYIYPVLDPVTRTISARIIFDNTDLQLKPNMFTNVDIHIGTKEQVLLIPPNAIIHQGGMHRVVRALGNGQFLSQRISLGAENNNQVEVLEGLNEGDVIVTSGQFLMDSESALNAELDRLETSSMPMHQAH